jgi:hypothetical protein
MTQQIAMFVVAVLWLASCVGGILVAAFRGGTREEDGDSVLKQVTDTFAPQVASILTCIFALPAAKAAMLSGTPPDAVMRDYLAILLSVVYCGLFDAFIISYAKTGDSATTIRRFIQVRPAVAFLVTAMLVFYFGKA